MYFHLLGPVEASRGGLRVPLAGTKMHTLLAALLFARGRVVPDTRISQLLWGPHPPATKSAQIYTYVSRLRKLLEPEVTLERRPPGYVLVTGESRVDVVEYERLDRLGRQALTEHRYEEAGALLHGAMDLWQGPLLGNVTGFLADEEAPQWEESRAATLEARVEADLALGRHRHIVAELTRLVADFPLRERMRAQLMTALYRCGRQADALRVFHEGRTVLADELGVDPGIDLTSTHEALLHGTLGPVAQDPAPPAAAPAVAPRPPVTAPDPAPARPAGRVVPVAVRAAGHWRAPAGRGARARSASPAGRRLETSARVRPAAAAAPIAGQGRLSESGEPPARTRRLISIRVAAWVPVVTSRASTVAVAAVRSASSPTMDRTCRSFPRSAGGRRSPAAGLRWTSSSC